MCKFSESDPTTFLFLSRIKENTINTHFQNLQKFTVLPGKTNFMGWSTQQKKKNHNSLTLMASQTCITFFVGTEIFCFKKVFGSQYGPKRH